MKKELTKNNLIRGNKKSQYYLVAAVIIVAIILGASVVTNYIVTIEKPIRFYDLSDELKEESARLVEYGIYNELDIVELVEDFTQNYFIKYAEQKEKDIDFVFIYGNKKDIKIATYENGTLDIGRPKISYEKTLFTAIESDFLCNGEVLNDNLEFKDQNIFIQNCEINGNIKIDGGRLIIKDSVINGNIEVKNTDSQLINNHLDGNAKITIKSGASDKNILIAENNIDGDVEIKGGILVIIGNNIIGNLDIPSQTVVVQAYGNFVGGNSNLYEETQIETVEVNVLDQVYGFDLNEGENFLFIITKEQKGEQYVTEG